MPRVQADLALAEKVERRLMRKVAAAEAARDAAEGVVMRGGPTGRAQVGFLVHLGDIRAV